LELVLGIAVVVGFASAGVASSNLAPLEQSLLKYVVYLSVLIGGALGGLIYSISRNRGFVVPHWDLQSTEDNLLPSTSSIESSANPARETKTGIAPTYTKYDLGTFADILVGIGGGIIIFNLVPQGDTDLFEGLLNAATDPTKPNGLGTVVSQLMKILAISLIGGFAGISLFDEAAKRISRQLEDSKVEILTNRGKIQQLQQNDQQESDIQFLLNPLVDPSLGPLSETQKDALKSSVIKAPLNVRNKVFERLQKAYDSNSISGTGKEFLDEADIQTRMTLQEGLLAGFDALITASEEQKRSGRGRVPLRGVKPEARMP
jgi:hypothetical protein